MNGLIYSLASLCYPHLPTLPPPPQIPIAPLSRRHALTLSLTSLPLSFLSSTSTAAANETFPYVCPSAATATSKVFLDISIDGIPSGRITVGLFGTSAPKGAARFSSLVSGADGVSYRRRGFLKITPTYIQHSGVRSYGADADLARHSGTYLAVEDLLSEWAATADVCGVRSKAWTVGIVVRDPLRPPATTRVVARNGRIVVEEEKSGTAPNGTEFVIATRDSPELDEKALVVGRVVDGMDVVERIAGVSVVRDNTASPYFRVAKLIGDKRAIVAERGFNRPYAKVVVTNCGLLMD
ncbi:hypothetical protein HPP92_008287 [Vanilla planifolia]|uniref:Peptidyl-prolyl cis-trans isomerase n=1 Tax=Vanilla planifolia TaxID=51239 RepID=A0A835V4C0_VANPL|nr:hypothetical protein HPP92_008287 [Vanilla planifolia]